MRAAQAPNRTSRRLKVWTTAIASVCGVLLVVVLIGQPWLYSEYRAGYAFGLSANDGLDCVNGAAARDDDDESRAFDAFLEGCDRARAGRPMSRHRLAWLFSVEHWAG